MTATTHAQRSPEWHAARVGRVTGSIAGAILGLNPNMSRDDAMRQMVRAREGAPDERELLSDFAKGIMDFGRYHEDGCIFDFRMETGLSVRPATFVTCEEWLGASPDGYTSDKGVLETKVPWSKRKDANPVFKSCKEQPHYFAQVQIECHVTGCGHGNFWQYRPGFTDKDGVSHEAVGVNEIVPRDDEWLASNLPRLKQFWAEYLDEPAEAHLSPKRPIVDTPAAHMMVAEWDDIMEAIGNLESRKKELLEEMVAMAGERNVEFAGRKLTKTIRSGQISYAKAIKELLPNADLSKWKGKDSEYWGLK